MPILSLAGIDAARAGIGDVDLFGCRPRTEDAMLTEDRIEHRVGSGERRGVRARGERADIGPADLHEDQRLLLRARRRQSVEKDVAVADAFGIGHHDLRLGLIDDPAQRLGNVDVAFIAGRDPVADAKTALTGEMREMRSVGAALRNDGDAARLDEFRIEHGRERAVVAGRHIEDAKAVRTQHAHPALARNARDLVLDPAPLVTGLGKAGGEDDGRLHATIGAVLQCLERCRRWNRENCDIGSLGQRADRGIGGKALHGRAVGIDRIDLSLEPALAQISERTAADARRILGRTDERHRTRRQQGIKCGTTIQTSPGFLADACPATASS